MLPWSQDHGRGTHASHRAYQCAEHRRAGTVRIRTTIHRYVGSMLLLRWLINCNLDVGQQTSLHQENKTSIRGPMTAESEKFEAYLVENLIGKSRISLRRRITHARSEAHSIQLFITVS